MVPGSTRNVRSDLSHLKLRYEGKGWNLYEPAADLGGTSFTRSPGRGDAP